MSENPAGWNEIQKTINEALRLHEENMRLHICGYTAVSTIYHALLEKGYLNLEKIRKEDR